MKKVLIYTLFLVMLTSIAFAQIDSEVLDASLEGLVGTRVPTIAEPLFGDTSMNIHLAQDDGSEVIVGIVSVDGIVTQASTTEVTGADLEVYGSTAVFENIIMASNPLSELSSAIDSGSVYYNVNGFWNKIKFTFIKWFLSSSDKIVADSLEENSSDNSTREVDDSQDDLESGDDTTVVEEDEEEIEQDQESDDNFQEEIEEEVTTDGDNLEEIQDEEVEEETEEVDDSIHTVEMTEEGFSPEELTISLGDTIVWENIRSGDIDMAMVVGSRTHSDIRSEIFYKGETFSHTFTQADDYIFVDGVMTTQVFYLTVE